MGRKSIKKDRRAETSVAHTRQGACDTQCFCFCACRGYITATEWKTEWGGFKDRSRLPYSKLPLHCCAISFTPFEDPVRSLATLFAYSRATRTHSLTHSRTHARTRSLTTLAATSRVVLRPAAQTARCTT